jgi:hypothetical protein
MEVKYTQERNKRTTRLADNNSMQCADQMR